MRRPRLGNPANGRRQNIHGTSGGHGQANRLLIEDIDPEQFDRIVGEVFLAQGTFTMADLLRFVNEINPIG